MPDAPQSTELLGQKPDPVQLLKDLEAPAMDTDQKKHNHLRDLFLEEADVDEYVQYLDTDEEIDLTKKQLAKLKGTLEGFKVYLKRYLEKSAGRIGSLDERLKKTGEEIVNPDLTPDEIDKIAHTRKRVAKALQIAKAPRGAKVKSLRDVTQKGSVSGVEAKKVLSPDRQKDLLNTIRARFELNMRRHQGIEWAKVQAKLEANPEKMWSLNEMERTGGEPDVVGYDKKTGEYIFNDCSAESPEGRRLVCCDREGQELAEKYGYHPEGNAIDMAKNMGIEVLTEAEYRELQKLGKFDLQTFSWLKTPVDIRKTGGALCGSRNGDSVVVDQRNAYGRVGRRAFRGSLRV